MIHEILFIAVMWAIWFFTIWLAFRRDIMKVTPRTVWEHLKSCSRCGLGKRCPTYHKLKTKWEKKRQ